MQLVIKEKNRLRINRILDWLLYMAGYTLIFILISNLFDSIKIDPHYSFLWSIVVVLLLYILNKTVKPILVTLTIPITGITLGLFYPFINLFILKLVDWLLRGHSDITNIYIAFFAAILIAIMNLIMEQIIKNIINKVKKNG